MKKSPDQWLVEHPEKLNAIRKILATVPGDEIQRGLADLLSRRILVACACAATYDKQTDTFFLQRKLLTVQGRLAKRKAQAAISKVRSVLREAPDLTTSAWLGAATALATRGVYIRPSEGMPLTDVVDTILAELYQGLERRPIGARAGPFMHRYSHGCLLYPQSVEDSSKLAAPETMLLFAVVFYFRRHAKHQFGMREGEKMPDDGESRYRLAAEIVQVVFPDTKIDEHEASNRLSQLLFDHPGVRLMSWPHDVPL